MNEFERKSDTRIMCLEFATKLKKLNEDGVTVDYNSDEIINIATLFYNFVTEDLPKNTLTIVKSEKE